MYKKKYKLSICFYTQPLYINPNKYGYNYSNYLQQYGNLLTQGNNNYRLTNMNALLRSLNITGTTAPLTMDTLSSSGGGTVGGDVTSKKGMSTLGKVGVGLSAASGAFQGFLTGEYSADAQGNGFALVDDFLTQGKSSKVGRGAVNAGASLMNAGLSTGNGALALAGGIVGTVGTIINNGWGSKVNEEKVAEIKGLISDTMKLTSNALNSTDFANDFSNMKTVDGFSKKDIGSDGVFAHKVRDLNRNLQAAKTGANNYALASYNTRGNNINLTNTMNKLSNMVAFGGPIEYALMLQQVNNNSMSAMSKNRLYSMPNSLNAFNNVGLFAFGGDVQGDGADYSTGLTHVDAGQTHEENPYLGVQMGVDSQGTPNLVEENETVYNDYVFSNRLKVPKQKVKKGQKATREQRLLNRYKGLTYADAAKKIEHNTGVDERPNDPIAKRGLEVDLLILAMSLEKERAAQELKEQKDQIDNMSAEEFAQLQAEQEQKLAMQLLQELVKALLQVDPLLIQQLIQQLPPEQLLLLQQMPPELQLLAIQLLIAQQLLALPSPDDLAMQELAMQQLLMLQPVQAYGGNIHADGGQNSTSSRILNGWGQALKGVVQAPAEIAKAVYNGLRYGDVNHDLRGSFKGGSFAGAGAGGTWTKQQELEAKDFNEAYDKAVKNKQKTFKFKGLVYNTKKENNPVREANNRFVGATRVNDGTMDKDYDYTTGPLHVGNMDAIPMVTNTYATGGDMEQDDSEVVSLNTVEQPEQSLDLSLQVSLELIEQPLEEHQELSQDESSQAAEDMSTALLNLTINLILLWARQNGDKELAKEARKAKRASREDKEDFVDDALDEIQEKEQEKQAQEQATQQTEDLQQAIDLLALLLMSPELQLAILLQVAEQLAMEQLAMLQQQVAPDLALQQDIEALMQAQGLLFAEGGGMTLQLLLEYLQILQLFMQLMGLSGDLNMLLYYKQYTDLMNNNQQLLALQFADLLYRQYVAALLLQLGLLYAYGGSMNLNNPNAGNIFNGLKVFAGKFEDLKLDIIKEVLQRYQKKTGLKLTLKLIKENKNLWTVFQRDALTYSEDNKAPLMVDSYNFTAKDKKGRKANVDLFAKIAANPNNKFVTVDPTTNLINEYNGFNTANNQVKIADKLFSYNNANKKWYVTQDNTNTDITSVLGNKENGFTANGKRNYKKQGYFDQKGNYIDNSPVANANDGTSKGINTFHAMDWRPKDNLEVREYERSKAYAENYIALENAIKNSDLDAIDYLKSVGAISTNNETNRYFDDNGNLKKDVLIDWSKLKDANGNSMKDASDDAKVLWLQDHVGIYKGVSKGEKGTGKGVWGDTNTVEINDIDTNALGSLYKARFDGVYGQNHYVNPLIFEKTVYGYNNPQGNYTQVTYDPNGKNSIYNVSKLDDITDENGNVLHRMLINANIDRNVIPLNNDLFAMIDVNDLNRLGATPMTNTTNMPADYNDLGIQGKTNYYTLNNPNDEVVEEYPMPSLAPYLGSIGINAGLGLYNAIKGPDTSTADALLEASKEAGNYTPISARYDGTNLKYNLASNRLALNDALGVYGSTLGYLTNAGNGNAGDLLNQALTLANNFFLGMGKNSVADLKYNNDLYNADANFYTKRNQENYDRLLLADAANQKALLKARQAKLTGLVQAALLKYNMEKDWANGIQGNIQGALDSWQAYDRSKTAAALTGWYGRNVLVPKVGLDRNVAMGNDGKYYQWNKKTQRFDIPVGAKGGLLRTVRKRKPKGLMF